MFAADLAYSVRRGIVDVDRAIPNLSWLVVVYSPRRTVRALLRNQWHNFRRNGWRWIPYQADNLWHRVLARFPLIEPASPGHEFALSALEARPNVRVLRVADIHSAATLAEVQAFEPDLGIALAAPILRPPLFSIPKLGTLNLHKGKVPEYRGMPPAFWELWNDAASVGCTVHWVDAKLDTGSIVRETAVERQKYSTLRGLQLLLDEIGIKLMRQAVSEVLSGHVSSTPQAPGGRTYRKPTLVQIAALNRKLTRDQPGRLAPIRHLVKEMVFVGGIVLWHLVLRWLVAPRIVVLLYHRVTDESRDNLTVGIEQFDRQMAMLRRHCQIVSLEDLVAGKVVPAAFTPVVCVTFDDGYLDNYLYAVPILLRHGIPASFFVSTGIVDTNRAFPHDVRRGHPPLPVMTWDQLREMRDRGFTIGSHSVSHIDCVAEPEEIVKTELTQSLVDLRRELKLQDAIFAYPYGGRQNMTPQRLDLVRQAGYSACLSAYGGVNSDDVDCFNILRVGMHWEFSDRAFLFRCLGLASAWKSHP